MSASFHCSPSRFLLFHIPEIGTLFSFRVVPIQISWHLNLVRLPRLPFAFVRRLAYALVWQGFKFDHRKFQGQCRTDQPFVLVLIVFNLIQQLFILASPSNVQLLVFHLPVHRAFH